MSKLVDIYKCTAGNSGCTAAGMGLKGYAKRHLIYLLIRQFKLLLQDLSISIELDQAVDLDLGEPCMACSAMKASTTRFPRTGVSNHAPSAL